MKRVCVAPNLSPRLTEWVSVYTPSLLSDRFTVDNDLPVASAHSLTVNNTTPRSSLNLGTDYLFGSSIFASPRMHILGVKKRVGDAQSRLQLEHRGYG